MKTFCFALLIIASATIAHAQENNDAVIIRFEGEDWRVRAQEAVVESHLGRSALKLTGGRVYRDDVQLADGVIEFDVAFEERTGFIGPLWRAERDDRFEDIYFRSHLSGKPDAVQYTPTENGLSAWQIFSDGNAAAAIPLKFEEWNRVKIVVEGDKADFYFNSDTPQLHVPDLKTDIPSGYVGLRASGPNGGYAHFSNITFRPLESGEGIIGEAKEPKPLPAGVIESWNVSAPFAEDIVSDTLMLPKNAGLDQTWRNLSVETNGIANLARLAGADEDSDTVFVRLKIDSDASQMKEMQFGYSDRVRIYLNGKRVFFGNAGWRVRDYRFLGTVGFFDSVGLDLKKGDNELLVAVSETFGGWAWAGAIEDQSGIRILK